jgi:uncharacterized protein YbaA (DUF1428 family)
MTDVDGVVAAVPAANKETYTRHATEAVPLFKEFGVSRLLESWGDDVPDGEVTDFKGAVKAKADEIVVFGFMEYPSRQARDAAHKKMMSDPRMKNMGETMPFDGKRMIFGGFETIVDEGKGRGGYLDGYLVPVPEGSKQAYRDLAKKAAGVFRAHGAIRVVEAWGVDVPVGEVTDYKRAVKAEKGEKIVYSWVVWPDKATRVEGWKKVMADPRMQPGANEMPFDGKRMIYGGFTPIVDK